MADKRLEGKVAIVTGASRGIGRAVALRLSRDGAGVVVNYVGRAALAGEVVKQIEQAGGQAIAVQADVSQVPQIKRLFDEAIRRFGRLDILINNAGVILYKTLEETSEEEFDRLFAINVKGTFFACHGERGVARADGYGAFQPGQDGGAETAGGETGSTGPAGSAGGCRGCGGVSGERGRAVDYGPDGSGQRRGGVSDESAGAAGARRQANAKACRVGPRVSHQLPNLLAVGMNNST